MEEEEGGGLVGRRALHRMEWFFTISPSFRSEAPAFPSGR